LNNDTTLIEGSIDELVRTFDEISNVAIVGSKLINQDGTLQEAGGIVQRLGNALNWGFGCHSDDPKYCYLRDVDYVSAASLMIPRGIFQDLRGFDEFFEPAYYEDTDLCFRARQAGMRVVVQPLSKVVHHGGATSGTSATAGTPKRYQNINQRKFLRRWDATLAEAHNAAIIPNSDFERHVMRRCVFIDDTTPTPDRDGGSNVAWAHMQLLNRLCFKVSFIPADNMAHMSQYTADLQRSGIECFYAPFTDSVENVFRRMVYAPPDLIYFHRISNAAPYMPLARKFFPSARLVYSVADLHFLRLSRQANFENREDLRTRATALEHDEVRAAMDADFVIVHSTQEATILQDRAPGAHVSVVQWPFKATQAVPDLLRRSGVAFVGGYPHQPNVDAALRLANHIMPLVRQQFPGLCLHLVGDRAPQAVLNLASDVVRVVGYASDLALALDSVLCTVAPLRYGAGIKVKVLTSLAMGLPCVMSEVAVEGIPLPDSLSWLVASSEAELAEKIVVIHQYPGLAERLSNDGLAFIRATYSEELILRDFALAIGVDVLDHLPHLRYTPTP
jgi:glycosyltransferase involved in cell wall biosynthesis